MSPCSGFRPFMITYFIVIVSTSRDCFRRIGKKPHAWRSACHTSPLSTDHPQLGQADRWQGWDGVPSQPCHRSAAMSVHCTKSCTYSQKVLPRMGEFVARNMQSWFEKINKRNLLYLVGCLHRCSNDARSHEHQVLLNHLMGFVLSTKCSHLIGNKLSCFLCFLMLFCSLSKRYLLRYCNHIGAFTFKMNSGVGDSDLRDGDIGSS